MKKTLIVYYSYSNGNTENIAKEINKEVKSDITQIELITPYSGTYQEVVDQGLKEVKSNFKPQIKDIDIKDYEVIILGTPTWWYTMAPAMLSFISNNDFKDKTVIPFMTNAGWPGTVIKDIKDKCNGNILLSKEITFDSNGGSKLVIDQKEIDEWIKDIKKLVEEQ